MQIITTVYYYCIARLFGYSTLFLILSIYTSFICDHMLKFLYWFTIFLLLYFVVSVTASYYLSDIMYGNLVLPIIKEVTWFIMIGYALWIYRASLVSFAKQTKYVGLLLWWIALWWIIATVLIYYYNNALDPFVAINIMIWLKYGLYASVIFYTAWWLGYASSITESDLSHYIKYICKALLWFIGIGIVWQLLKWIVPDLFYNVLWYGPVGDYVAGQAHPIYYRTGAGGLPRFSWLMSWPNNLWYLLVAYASIVPLYFNQGRVKVLYYGSTLATISRAAMVWVWSQLVLIAARWYRRSKILLSIIVWLWLAAIIWLSVLKAASTREHITRTLGSLDQVIQSPQWIWLWSSWPWVHRGGSVLPENFYIQLLLDYGTIPFIARCGMWYLIIKQSKLIIQSEYHLSWQLRAYVAWFVGLLIVWLFLHVFEDSVVNYLFFIPFGLLRWQWLRTLAKSDM